MEVDQDRMEQGPDNRRKDLMGRFVGNKGNFIQ